MNGNRAGTLLGGVTIHLQAMEKANTNITLQIFIYQEFLSILIYNPKNEE